MILTLGIAYPLSSAKAISLWVKEKKYCKIFPLSFASSVMLIFYMKIESKLWGILFSASSVRAWIVHVQLNHRSSLSPLGTAVVFLKLPRLFLHQLVQFLSERLIRSLQFGAIWFHLTAIVNYLLPMLRIDAIPKLAVARYCWVSFRTKHGIDFKYYTMQQFHFISTDIFRTDNCIRIIIKQTSCFSRVVAERRMCFWGKTSWISLISTCCSKMFFLSILIPE